MLHLNIHETLFWVCEELLGLGHLFKRRERLKLNLKLISSFYHIYLMLYLIKRPKYTNQCYEGMPSKLFRCIKSPKYFINYTKILFIQPFYIYTTFFHSSFKNDLEHFNVAFWLNLYTTSQVFLYHSNYLLNWDVWSWLNIQQLTTTPHNYQLFLKGTIKML